MITILEKYRPDAAELAASGEIHVNVGGAQEGAVKGEE